jgi:hypothetical protein
VIFKRAREPRGVTVFNEQTAEEYPTADNWIVDDKGTLHLFAPDGRGIATYVVATWFRVVVGIKPTPTP